MLKGRETDGQVYVLVQSPSFRLWRELCSWNGRRMLNPLSSLRGGCCVLVEVLMVPFRKIRSLNRYSAREKYLQNSGCLCHQVSFHLE